MRLKLQLTLITFLSVFTMMAQERTVSGTVTAADDGGTLPGVNVLIKGTTTGAVTDIDGNYKLTTPSGDVTLVFSFVGFTNQEILLEARSIIDVILVPDISQLEEIVVTGSAVGKSKKTLSFSIGTIDEEMMTTVPPATLGVGLQGKVAGLRVNSVGG